MGFGATLGKEAFLRAEGETKTMLSAFFSKEQALPSEHWFHRVMRVGPNRELSHILLHSSQDSLAPLVNELNEHGFAPLDIALVTGNKELF